MRDAAHVSDFAFFFGGKWLHARSTSNDFKSKYKSFEVYCYAIRLNEMYHECKHICIFFLLDTLSFAFIFLWQSKDVGNKNRKKREMYTVASVLSGLKGECFFILLIPIRNNYFVNITWFISVLDSSTARDVGCLKGIANNKRKKMRTVLFSSWKWKMSVLFSTE